MLSLKDQQRKLRLNLIKYNKYDVEQLWSVHPLIADLRKKIKLFFPKDTFYDPQDLEDQVLFRLTTYDPTDITDIVLQTVVDEQYAIMRDRLSQSNCDTEYIFRGLSGKYHDLNINDRLELCWDGEKLIAKNNKRSFNVEFRVVHDEKIISLFSSDLHYIHQDRPKGETFGFYFAGDTIPWALETTEPSAIAKQYKRDALLGNGIDPNKAVELTRFYTLPGAPTNAISLMDGLVAKYYKAKGIEALYTTTMPMYSKTKSTTIAGGLNKTLLVKDLRHKFIPVTIDGKKCFRHVTTIPEDHTEIEVIKTHPNFPTMLVVEVFRSIDTTSLKPITMLENGDKVIYVTSRDGIKIEKEIKIKISDIAGILTQIRKIATYKETNYIRDVIYGIEGDKKKIRLRVSDNLLYQNIEATHKYKVSTEDGIKKEVEELIYKGNSMDKALEAIMSQGKFKEENSYEKIRVLFVDSTGTEITIDTYPFGVWLEIEGENENIHAIAKKLGFKKENYSDKGADDLYLEWIKTHSLKEMWDVRFGLNGKK